VRVQCDDGTVGVWTLASVIADGADLHSVLMDGGAARPQIYASEIVAIEPAQTPGDEQHNGDNPPAGPQLVATKGTVDTLTQPVTPGPAVGAAGANGASQ
jgi:hypothetical protein